MNELYYDHLKKVVSTHRLQMELIPKTAWNKSLANGLISKTDWDILRKWTYQQNDYHCYICKVNQTGVSGGLHGHEIWDFNKDTKIQKLVNIVALCPSCHHAIHIGFAQTIGSKYFNKIREHYMKVNQCTNEEFNQAMTLAKRRFDELSATNWTIDIELANDLAGHVKL